jgi:hypothetical protein
MRTIKNKLKIARPLLAAACLFAFAGAHAAKIDIKSRDPAGIGFNDPTPVAPVGGNPGTTLGEQRWNVYKYVAGVWEQALKDDVTITVSAGWEALACNSNQAVLGSAGAWNIWHDFPGGQPGTWYPQALANKLAGVNLSAGNPDDGSGYGGVDIKTQFNANLGNPGCLDGLPFYLGLDGNTGGKINFVETLLHELGHGLGFSVISVYTPLGLRINAAGTAYTNDGLPSVWEQFMYDNTAKKTWLNMTSNERRLSAINPLGLAWIGTNAVKGAATMLNNVPVIRINSMAPGGERLVDYNAATFGAPISNPGPLGQLAAVAAQAGELGNACSPLDAANTAAVRGKTALISRGGCAFSQKVKNAQNAGAVGAVLANNVAGPIVPGGSDPTITIPAAGISKADGDMLRAALAPTVNNGGQVVPDTIVAQWSRDKTRWLGGDGAGRPLLYTPATLVGGSSVSHWDVSASPNLLMEPNINPDLGTKLTAPKDLTLPVLKDIGW